MEADRELVKRWLDEPTMARQVPPGSDWAHKPAELAERSTRAFESSADLIETRMKGRR
jgi:hypothetical protein